jgi:drug/metabolite transporter (DMT)-like permease
VPPIEDVLTTAAKRRTKSAAAQKPLPANARLKGIALMCAAVLCFTGIDTSAKYLNHYMDTLQVVWARYLGAFLIGCLLVNPLLKPELLRTARPWLQLGRSALLLFSTVLNIYALRYLQLDETLSILFATPLLVAALSIPILGESIGPRRWAAIIVGFLGIMIITRPGFGNMHPAALLTVLGTVCYAVYSISTRILSATDSSGTTLFYSSLFGAVVMTAILPFVWSWPVGPLQIAVMVIMGTCGALGHYLLILAHRLAPASILAPFIYTQIVWMVLSGYLVFGDLPTHWTLIGGAVVIASGLYLLYRERKMRGEAGPAASSELPQ